ncbi:hypothetical protein OF385_05565 [Glutamicibacter sp. JL.03c]|nr:hypothetical protein [Glutamicibacter sp. JL.03c]UYQ78611.1 hypothetical protein OF385_05565 [Glutamicibacter sp. JL.03c]
MLARLWDLAQASGQLADSPRSGRFVPPQPVSDEAPALDRLAAFLGQPVL